MIPAYKILISNWAQHERNSDHLLCLVKKGDKEVHLSNSDTSSCNNFLDLVSEALNSTKSKPSSLQTRDTVVVLPEIFFQIKNHHFDWFF